MQQSIAEEKDLISNNKEFNVKKLEKMDPILCGIIKIMNTAGILRIQAFEFQPMTIYKYELKIIVMRIVLYFLNFC